MATGYEDIDNLMNQQNQNLEQQKILNEQIINTGLQKTQNEVERQKKEYDEEATKSAKALYSDYKKQSNPYGANAEQLASQGLNKSGYAESSQVNLYNTYQKNVTELITTANKLKADKDFEMNQAYLEADIQKAQNTLAIYQQQAQLALTEYQLKYDREKFDYQKYRDTIADSQWEKQFAMQEQQNHQAQSNWEREYNLSLENSRNSASKKRSSSNGNVILLDDNTTNTTLDSLSDKAILLNQRLTYLYDLEDEGFNYETVQKSLQNAKDITETDSKILSQIWKNYLG